MYIYIYKEYLYLYISLSIYLIDAICVHMKKYITILNISSAYKI